VEELSDRELLSVVVGGDRSRRSLDWADELLELAGSLGALSRLGTTLVAGCRKMGRTRAVRLRAAFELGRRGLIDSVAPVRVDSVDEVRGWAEPRLLGLEHEEVWLLSVDGRNYLRTARCIARGGLHGCALATHDILRPAVRDAASAIILVHNHPSGDPTPSPEDLRMTRAVQVACRTIGLELLDHVIVARGGATSLFDLGVLS
jgi:DNA repair protein RadC